MLHQGFIVSLGSQLISIKTSHDPKMAMLYNTKYVNPANTDKSNLKYNNNTLLDNWRKPLETVAAN